MGRQSPPVPEQMSPVAQVPHEPPQPSVPHVFPAQSGVHAAPQVPLTHRSVRKQRPQTPPQPSEPHVFPAQSGAQDLAKQPDSMICAGVAVQIDLRPSARHPFTNVSEGRLPASQAAPSSATLPIIDSKSASPIVHCP